LRDLSRAGVCRLDRRAATVVPPMVIAGTMPLGRIETITIIRMP
jgi:hypothetical protein